MLSALRHADRDLGDRATLMQADTYTDALEQYGRPVLVHEPTSFAAERFVHRLRKQGLVADVLPTPTFALPRKDFASGPAIAPDSAWRTSTATSAAASTC